jgi:flagellar protein FlgJ
MSDLIADTHLSMLRQAQLKTLQAAETAKLSKDMDIEAINKAAEEFEAVFLTEMMKPMFEGIEPDPMFGGGKGEEIFQGMMLEQYGKAMAARGGIGIADQVKAEMIRMQAEANSQRQTTDLPQ